MELLVLWGQRIYIINLKAGWNKREGIVLKENRRYK